jgi:hypothetical protein
LQLVSALAVVAGFDRTIVGRALAFRFNLSCFRSPCQESSDQREQESRVKTVTLKMAASRL